MSRLNELDQGDQKKINKLLSEAGISSLDWDIKDWTDASMVARTKFYFDLLKHDLTSY
jgi:hypothetical protein